MEALLAAMAGGVVTALAVRAARRASLNDPLAVAALLEALRAAGADDVVQTLLARNPAVQVNPASARNVAELLLVLHIAGADDAVAVLAGRAAGQVSLDDPLAVAGLLGTLRAGRTGEPTDTLAARVANAGLFDLFLKACPDQAANYLFGREPDGDPSQFWNWQEPH